MALTLAPETICQSLIALNLAGVDPSKEEFSTYALSLASNDSLEKLSREELIVLDKLCSTIKKNTRGGAEQSPEIIQLRQAIKSMQTETTEAETAETEEKNY